MMWFPIALLVIGEAPTMPMSEISDSGGTQLDYLLLWRLNIRKLFGFFFNNSNNFDFFFF